MTAQQPPPPLFAGQFPDLTKMVPHNGTDTSIAAAKVARHGATAQYARMLAIYRERGTEGMTDEEMAEHTAKSGEPIRPDAIRPRRGALIADQLVVDSGTKRATRSGCMATVFVAKEFKA